MIENTLGITHEEEMIEWKIIQKNILWISIVKNLFAVAIVVISSHVNEFI